MTHARSSVTLQPASDIGRRGDLDRDSAGGVALLLALQEENYDVAAALINQGANVNSTTHTGEKALSLATKRNALFVVRLLCDQAHIDINAADRNGVTALMHAADYADRYFDPTVLNFLLSSGADAELCDGEGCTALLRAAKGTCYFALEKLIEGGAETRALDANGCGAMMLAAKHGNFSVLEYLLQHRDISLIQEVRGVAHEGVG